MDILDELEQNSLTPGQTAITVELVDLQGNVVESFHPKVTYQLFGDQELVYGYKGLDVRIKLDSLGRGKGLVQVHYESKVEEDEDEDKEFRPVEEILVESVPQGLVTDIEKVDTLSSEEFPGERVDEFGGVRIYRAKPRECASLQILPLFFIEAASVIELDDDRWDVYLIYKQVNDSYCLAGFATVYPYFWFSSSKEHDLEDIGKCGELGFPLRERISQFVVLPPFQGKGIGAKLYNKLIDLFVEDESVRDVAVEDPNEQFDDLRDRCDIQRLVIQRKDELWNELVNDSTRIMTEDKTQLRRRLKIAPRQLDRLIEMALLKKLGQDNRQFEIYVKKRLFIRNADALEEMSYEKSKTQVKKVLQETYDQLMSDYTRILEPLKFKKRKRIDDI